MLTDSNLQSITALIASELERVRRDADERGYARGKSDAKSEMLALLQGAKQPDGEDVVTSAASTDLSNLFEENRHLNRAPNYKSSDSERKRAPKGLPAAFTRRALEGLPQGSTAKEIAATATTADERMVQESTIRGELRKGRDAGDYEERNGRWYFVKRAMPGF